MTEKNIVNGENYGDKANVLVNKATPCVQTFLMDKIINYNNNDGAIDFFSFRPNRSSNKMKEKIASRDITTWDITLCVTWLLAFTWGPQTELSEEEIKALTDLKDMRNEIKHDSSPSNLSESGFSNYCSRVKTALEILEADSGEIKRVIDAAKHVLVTDKRSIEQLGHKWKFTTNRILGSGSFGVVISANDSLDKREYAIKIIPQDQDYHSKENALREPRQLAKLNHPNVVPYISSGEFSMSVENFKNVIKWESSEKELNYFTKKMLRSCFDIARDNGNNLVNGLYIKMEICGEPLREWLNSQVDSHTKTNVSQYEVGLGIIDGLKYIHSKEIIHRDLRPENIFFTKEGFTLPVKIGDFGTSKEIEIYTRQTHTLAVGKDLYRAPEIDNGKDGKAKYSQKADLFSLGLILSEVFDPVQVAELKDKFNLITCNRNTGNRIKERPSLNKLILKLTRKVPERRITKTTINN